LLPIIAILFFSLIFAPEFLDEMLQHAVASIAHYAGSSVDLGFDDLPGFVVKASIINLAQVFIIFFVLLAVLFLITWLLRRLLTWYALPRAEARLMKMASLTVVLGTLFCGLTILPPITVALLRHENFLNPFLIVAELFGLLLAVTGLGCFLYADRKYARRCPFCNAPVSGPPRFDKRCKTDTCNALLFPWLIAEYET
ncbi:MAG: hypothetical protein KJ638_10095, partial [Chloroflexi bacterium]|nr:hypothetical protein [Chloroflexota bacterium]